MTDDIPRTRLDAILDELIPPNPARAIPGAGALGVADFVLTARDYAPDPAGAAGIVTEAAGAGFEARSRADKIAALERIEAARPEAFSTLVRLTYMGYYSRPETRPLFGVGAHPVHPQGYPVAGESAALLAEMTAPVRARGKAYRDAE